MPKEPNKPKEKKATKLGDLKIKKDVKGGCFCQGMPSDPGSRTRVR